MAARPRRHNVTIPNLYCKLDKRTSKVYWQYRHPVTNQFIGFGTDEDAAKEAAIEANRIISQQQTKQITILVDMALKKEAKLTTGMRLFSWIEIYEKICNERIESGEIAKSTGKALVKSAKILEKRLPNVRLRNIDTKALASIIDEYKSEGKNRMAQFLRANWIDMFKEAQHSGEVDQGYNPALATRKVHAKVKRARLSFDEWQKIYEAAKNTLAPAASNSMLLALITGQRRTDIAKMKFSDVWDDHLHIEQSKTGAKIALPLSLRCNALGMSLGEAIAICRDRVLSPYMIHHVRNNRGKKPGDPIWEDSLSRYFSEARISAGVNPDKDQTPPSFHEQRSLSERLYRAQGINTQLLLGHKSIAMTDKYNDDRGADWKKLAL
ncbi:phage integrase Arm DNA-binding domain-containing protein [Pantoea sp. At-9b]|uniref:phage integrase Arm DNA-binding domain-containing protein n=1 Tax=Pantoea sp. (strain At-9b) TaxID=592316 RepID=UPI0001B3E1F0|nr:phage integrase Arm DNA-binding domain-containing protein [Pantoea sp. At-9b]ADU71510.1 lambda integrase [Pantoea sp. At-9b]